MRCIEQLEHEQGSIRMSDAETSTMTAIIAEIVVAPLSGKPDKLAKSTLLRHRRRESRERQPMLGQSVDSNFQTVMPVMTWVPTPLPSGRSPLSI